jgi:hypothetical protein
MLAHDHIFPEMWPRTSKPTDSNSFPFLPMPGSSLDKLDAAKSELLPAIRATSHQRARMVADEGGGTGNQQAQDDSKR